MYSPNATERLTASAVIDHVESYIISCLPLSHPAGEDRHEDPNGASDEEQDKEFQIIQAAFTMVITLFWTGTGAQKLRASTGLFDIVVEVRALCVYFEVRQHLMTSNRTECALIRLDDLRTVTRRQAY
jgi:hypothetical protein